MKRFVFILSIFIFAMSLQASSAKEDKYVKYGDWNVFQSETDGDPHCVAYAKPYRSTGSIFERNSPFMVISNRGQSDNSIGVHPGYGIAGEKGFTITVNRKSYLLDIKLAANAWTFTDKEDVTLLNDMLEDGRYIQIRGYDKVGNVSVDYYSLRGLSYVLQHLNNNCENN